MFKHKSPWRLSFMSTINPVHVCSYVFCCLSPSGLLLFGVCKQVTCMYISSSLTVFVCCVSDSFAPAGQGKRKRLGEEWRAGRKGCSKLGGCRLLWRRSNVRFFPFSCCDNKALLRLLTFQNFIMTFYRCKASYGAGFQLSHTQLHNV